MSLKVLYVDLRNTESHFESYLIDWLNDMTAEDAVYTALGGEMTDQVMDDLDQANRDLSVFWINRRTLESRELGELTSLDWAMSDRSILAVVYGDDTTTNEQVGQSNAWMFQQWDFD